jgi:simple sugar transport system substrate-binding protein
MIDAGVDVLTSIAGGAAQGLIRAIQDKGAYSVFFNTNEYGQAPGFIAGCGLMEQKKLVKEILRDFIDGKIQYGTARVVGVKEGYLNFIDDPAFRDYVPADIQAKFLAFMDELRAGNVEYSVPPL